MPVDPLVQELRVRLSQVPGGPVREPELEQAVRGARGFVDAYMRTRIGGRWTGFEDPWPAASARVVYGTGENILRLPPYNRGSVTAVSVGGAPMTSTTWTEHEGSGTLLRLSTPYFENMPQSYWGRVPYTVTAQWGFGPMDDGVLEVLLQLATNLWRGRDRGMWTDTINPLGAPSLVFTGGLTAEQRMVLDAVVDPWVRHVGSIGVTVEGPRYRTQVQGNW